MLACALAACADALGPWFSEKCPLFGATEREFALKAALRQSKLDAFNAGVVLAATFKIPVDEALCAILTKVTSVIPQALRIVTREWAVLTGYRFPGAEDDVIEWLDGTHRTQRGGKVTAVDPAMGIGLVAWDGGSLVRVFGEDVTANVTQDWYSPRVQVLGQRYDDAPARAAEWEANRGAYEEALHAQAPPEPAKPAILVKTAKGLITLEPCPACLGQPLEPTGEFVIDLCVLCSGQGFIPKGPPR